MLKLLVSIKLKEPSNSQNRLESNDRYKHQLTRFKSWLIFKETQVKMEISEKYAISNFMHFQRRSVVIIVIRPIHFLISWNITMKVSDWEITQRLEMLPRCQWQHYAAIGCVEVAWSVVRKVFLSFKIEMRFDKMEIRFLYFLTIFCWQIRYFIQYFLCHSLKWWLINVI